MSHLDKVLYTAKTHTTGGRDGASRSSDGRLDVKLSSPGTAGGGTNPSSYSLPAGRLALSVPWESRLAR
jgi:organic hydroperoxide reductase OsmC/OhrA